MLLGEHDRIRRRPVKVRNILTTGTSVAAFITGTTCGGTWRDAIGVRADSEIGLDAQEGFATDLVPLGCVNHQLTLATKGIPPFKCCACA